jgi:hypothetical protein
MDPIDADLVRLHREDATPSAALRGIRDAHGISLTDAKVRLMHHPDWSKEARVAEQLHEELFEVTELFEADREPPAAPGSSVARLTRFIQRGRPRSRQ